MPEKIGGLSEKEAKELARASGESEGYWSDDKDNYPEDQQKNNGDDIEHETKENAAA